MLVPAAAPPASLSAQYDELATEYQELARASVALVKAIHTMRASPEHKHVFELYAAHRFTYSGPDVILEMVAVVETIGRHRAG